MAVRILNFIVVCSMLIQGLPPNLLAQETNSSDVPQVTNGKHPRDGVRHVQLEELWRAGGEDDQIFFGLVAKVATDDQGRVYVLDSQTCQVYLYSPAGELIRILFREGEGPGEIRRARDMVVMGDGRVGVIQEFPGTISYVHADGTPAGRTQFTGPEGGVVNLTSCEGQGDILLLAGNHSREGRAPGIQERVNCLERYGEEGQILSRYQKNLAEYDFSHFIFRENDHLPPFWFSYAVDRQGLVYSLGNHTDYTIHVHRSDGKALRTISREYQELKRTREEIQRLKGIVLSAFNGSPIQPTIEINDMESPFAYFQRSLQVHADGSLWVLSSRGVRPTEPGVMAVFDVFDRDGHFIQQTALHADHDGQEVGIFLSGPDRILVVRGYMDSLAAQFGNGTAVAQEGYEPQPPEVICYAIL